MRFFIDHNLSPVLVASLSAVIPEHEYRCALDEGLEDALDIPLFRELTARGFDAIITRDGNQLQDKDERRALIESGLHWLGLSAPKTGGLVGIALDSAAITSGVALVLPELTPGLQRAYLVRAIPREVTQRVKELPLRV